MLTPWILVGARETNESELRRGKSSGNQLGFFHNRLYVYNVPLIGHASFQ